MYIIKTYRFKVDGNYTYYGDALYTDYKGKTLKEAMNGVNDSRNNTDCTKLSPLTIYNVINTEED